MQLAAGECSSPTPAELGCVGKAQTLQMIHSQDAANVISFSSALWFSVEGFTEENPYHVPGPRHRHALQRAG